MALMLGSLARLDWTDVLPKLATIPVRYECETYLQSQVDVVKAKLPSAKADVYQAGHALFVDEADKFNQMLEEVMVESAKLIH